MHVALYFAFFNPGYSALLLDSKTPPLSRLISLLVRGLPRGGNLPFFTTPSPGCRSHSTSFLSLLLVPSGYVEIFSFFGPCCIACWLLVPWRGIEPGLPWHWKYRVLTIGLPGNSTWRSSGHFGSLNLLLEFCVNCSTCRYVFNASMGKGELPIIYHLDPHPPKIFKNKIQF